MPTPSSSAVLELVERQHQGWAYLRPVTGRNRPWPRYEGSMAQVVQRELRALPAGVGHAHRMAPTSPGFA